jgi:hypothetical protein
MNRYLVETIHNEADCQHVLEQFVFHGFIYNYEWGCKDGCHSGWAIVEANDKNEALLTVPPHLRSKARATQLVRYTPEMIQSSHHQGG